MMSKYSITFSCGCCRSWKRKLDLAGKQ